MRVRVGIRVGVRVGVGVGARVRVRVHQRARLRLEDQLKDRAEAEEHGVRDERRCFRRGHVLRWWLHRCENVRSQRRLIDGGEISWLRRAAAASSPTAPPCPGTTWKNRSRGGVSYGLKRLSPVLVASTRARLSSGTHHPDADVVSEDLQCDREVPVVERNPER